MEFAPYPDWIEDCIDDYFEDDIQDLAERSPGRANLDDLAIATNPVQIGRGSAERNQPNPDGEGVPTPGRPHRQDKSAHRSRIMGRQAHIETRRLNPAYRKLVDAIQNGFPDLADQILEDLRLFPAETHLGVAAKLRLMSRELASRPSSPSRDNYLKTLLEASRRYCTMKGFTPNWSDPTERHEYIEVVRAVDWVESWLTRQPSTPPLQFKFKNLPTSKS